MSYSNLQALPHYHQLHRTASTRLARPQSQQQQQQQLRTQQPQKDYSTPLHVDCSVEYELPERYASAATSRSKGSGGSSERLLMVHPCYFRKLELHRRSPFVNNMPVEHSPNRRSKVLAPVKNTIVVPTSAKNNSKHSINAAIMAATPHHVEPQMMQTPCQSAQVWRNHQLDPYVQRQMIHNSQQAQYPVEQERQQHDWGYPMGLGGSKRYARDEKTAVVAIPRSGPESIPIQSAKISVTPMNDNVRLYRGPVIQKADRDPILTSGCVYQVTNGNFNSLWEPIQKSPAIPFSAYQVGLDSKGNQSSAANNFGSMTRHSLSETSVIRHCNEELSDTKLSAAGSSSALHNHSHYQSGQQHYRSEKSTHNSNANSKAVVKCRQRWAPYSLDNITAPVAGMAPYFPNDPFPKIQQVSCYNV